MASIGSKTNPIWVDANGAAVPCEGGTGTSSTGAFVYPGLSILKTTEYNFPVAWTPGQYVDYTVANDCMLFYHIQMRLNGQIVNTDKLFSMSVLIDSSTEIIADAINPVTDGSDFCVGSIACKAGTVIRLKNASDVTLPVSTTSEPLFYILREAGPLQQSSTFDGLMKSGMTVKRTIDYTFTEDWTANTYREYVISNDCMLSYKFQIKSDGQIVNNDRKFMMLTVVDGTEIPIDGVNEITTGDDVRVGTILCKTGAIIRMKNVSDSTLPASSQSFYTLKEIA